MILAALQAVHAAAGRVLGVNPQMPAGPQHPRSTHWPAFRARVIAGQPACECCGRAEKLEVHHIVPFHIEPNLELERENVMVLCEGDTWNCHLWVGHLGDFRRRYNPEARHDAAVWWQKICTAVPHVENTALGRVV